MLRLCALLPLIQSAIAAVTSVQKVDHGPTGYEVTFRYHPTNTTTKSPKSVLLGGFPLYANALTASLSTFKQISPWDWTPDDFPLWLHPAFPTYGNITWSGINMTYEASSGDWVTTVPFPSGTFDYAFYPDCTAAAGYGACTAVADPGNPPITANWTSDTVSVVQVPFDSKYQTQDYSYQLPLEDASKRGSISFHTYPSPNSTLPSKNIHGVGVYLPSSYSPTAAKKYPVLYLQHGGSMNEASWFAHARAHHIFDRLIASGAMPPTVVITPTYSGIGFTRDAYNTNTTCEPGFDCGLTAWYDAIRANYLAYLVPWVESSFSVYTDRKNTAFTGFSLGGGLAITMLLNATEKFGYVGVVSNTPGPPLGDTQYLNPLLNETGIMIGAGFYDAAFQNARNLQDRLGTAGVLGYKSRYFMYSGHQWATWQDVLREFCLMLWK